jgi:hypothetical protein
MKKQTVTLEIVFDENENYRLPPAEWDWTAIIDLDGTEGVTVMHATPVEEHREEPEDD